MGIEYKITGVLELIGVSVIMIYLMAKSIPQNYALIVAGIFIAKGIGFAIMKQNPLSLSDAIAGLYLLFSVLGWFSIGFLNVIAIGWLVQKGIVQLFR